MTTARTRNRPGIPAKKTVKPRPWADAERALAKADPIMRAIIRQVGPCTLKPRRDYFVVLCKSVCSQQLSTKSAATIFGRFRDQFSQRRPTPQGALKFLHGDPANVRAVGLSRQKAAYLCDLSERWIAGKIPSARFARMEDEAIIEVLDEVKGFGRWTAEMFLMFVLNRPDVLPVDDLGIRMQAGKAYGLPDKATQRDVLVLGEKWRPWRTVASWYLWRWPGPKR